MRSTTSFARAGCLRFQCHPAVLIAFLVPALGLVFANTLLSSGIAIADDWRGEVIVTLMLFAAQDRPGALAYGAVLAIAVLLAMRTTLADTCAPSHRAATRTVGLLAATGAVLSWLAGTLVFRGYGMSLDEFMPEFQAEIFRQGRLMAPLSPEMLPYHGRLQPLFALTDEQRGLWASNYRPGHAMLLAITPRLGGFSLLNPLLTSLSVWAVADIARRLWPDRPALRVLAAALLLVTPQVIVNAGSGFSYPAHLAFSLLWLALFLKGAQDNRLAPHVAAAAVGAFAIGLHQVHVHAFFAAPFLLLLLLGSIGRRRHLLPYVLLYLVALPVWILWPELSVWLTTGDASSLPRRLGEVEYFADFLRYTDKAAETETPFHGLFLQANILRYLLWLCPALAVLTGAALMQASKLGALGWAAAGGVLLTIVANHVLMPNQMHGWGSRYYHPVIANLIVLSLCGYVRLREQGGIAARRATETALLLVIGSALVLVPQRLVQAHAKVAPRAAVQQAIAGIDSDVVLIPPLEAWFLGDFIRNTPLLDNRPLIMTAPAVEPDLADLPAPVRGGSVHVLTMKDLAEFGLPHGTLYEPGPANRP